MKDNTKISLFPLNVVLYPRAKVPLYIFEDRYKKMINKCLEENNSFGINMVIEEKIQPVGCTAAIDKVTKKYGTGEMNIIVQGVQRYKLKNYEMSLMGYYVGEVEYKSESDSGYDFLKMEKTVNLYNEFVEMVYKGSIKTIDIGSDKWKERSLSYFMAEKSGLSLAERQLLLEMDSEEARMEYVLKYLEEVMPKVKEAGRISDIIKSDGYIQ